MADTNRYFMNKAMGRHLGMDEAEPGNVTDEAHEKTSPLTCPACGAKLTVEAESQEEENREAGMDGEEGSETNAGM